MDTHFRLSIEGLYDGTLLYPKINDASLLNSKVAKDRCGGGDAGSKPADDLQERMRIIAEQLKRNFNTWYEEEGFDPG